jgi:hypothetical protein
MIRATECGSRLGRSYVLKHRRAAEKYPHLAGKRGGRAKRWFLFLGTVATPEAFAGDFKTKGEALDFLKESDVVRSEAVAPESFAATCSVCGLESSVYVADPTEDGAFVVCSDCSDEANGEIAEAGKGDLVSAIRAISEAGHLVHIPAKPGKVVL